MSAISGECKHRERDIWGVRRYNADRTKRQRREEHDVLGMVAGRHRAAADRAERNADEPLPANAKRTCLPRPDVLGGSTDCEGRTDEHHPVREDTIRRWVSGRYQIALRFNRYDVCLGVEEEIDG